jgi:diguanylate cyclase (GGDEF)-like protein
VTALSALDNGAEEVMMDNRFVQEGGSAVYLQWLARPVPGTQLWWASGRDTTQFHRLLAERADLRTQLELAVGQSTAAMWEFDLVKSHFVWEAQAAQLLGVASDAVPVGIGALVELIRPEDGAALQAAFESLVTAGSTEVGFRLGYEAQLRYLSLRGRVLDRDRRGRPMRAVGLILDVTAEKAMEEQMLRMVMSDALTGVPNRRAFDQSLRGEWRRCTRNVEPISVLMIDIDDFKGFNDNYGHLVGDAALCAVARALATTVNRAGDSLARFGGEEFAVVLPSTDASGAMTIAEQIVESVRGVVVRQAAGRTLTVSVGVASWSPGDAVTKAAALLEQADKALYVAKSAGKNRAVACEHDRSATA